VGFLTGEGRGKLPFFLLLLLGERGLVVSPTRELGLDHKKVYANVGTYGVSGRYWYI